MRHTPAILTVALLSPLDMISAAEWIHTQQPHWGLRNGLQFALHPAGFGERDGGPRGLIRVGAPVLPNGGHALVNFIAVEPVVNGKRGFSELDWSRLDSTRGIRFWAEESKQWSPAPGVEQLDVPVNVEAFANGAHVRLIVSQRSDAPDELRFTIHSQSGSQRIESCILTATMGNLVRARRLWLRDEVLSSLKLYRDFRGSGFARHCVRPLEQLTRNPDGDVIVAITSDEADPAKVFPFPGQRWWHYPGVPVTQYWKVSERGVSSDLRVAVNGRYTYWQSRQPIPGGVAFENFELVTQFREGQQFIFGITRRSPSELSILSRVQAKE